MVGQSPLSSLRFLNECSSKIFAAETGLYAGWSCRRISIILWSESGVSMTSMSCIIELLFEMHRSRMLSFLVAAVTCWLRKLVPMKSRRAEAASLVMVEQPLSTDVVVQSIFGRLKSPSSITS